ncbi:MAG: threonine/serine exporter family protein [Oscillospiraceae bacterium]
MEIVKNKNNNSCNNNIDILAKPHVFPHIYDTTNFTQDVTIHSDLTIVFTYIVMGIAWAGKAGLTFNEMLIAGFSCTFLGLVIITLERLKTPTYIARFFGALLAAFVIMTLNSKFHFTTQCASLMLAMVMPVATGMMVVDGLYTFIKGKKKGGMQKMVTGILCSVALGTAVFIATGAMGV